MGARLNRVDEIRGITLISMILYHFMWDLVYLAGFNFSWYTSLVGHIWQKSICISFIIISGFCFSMGKNRIKRGFIVFLSGALVSMVTLLVMPENRVVFGVLTFLGTASFIMIPVDKAHRKLEERLDKITLNLTMIIGSLLLFIAFFNVNAGYIFFPLKTELPRYLYKGYAATFMGFPDNTFFSTDYFAIIPWIFIYMFGYYVYRLYISGQAENTEKKQETNRFISVREYLMKDRFKYMSLIGKYSLIIYLLHQPLLYLLTILIEKIS